MPGVCGLAPNFVGRNWARLVGRRFQQGPEQASDNEESYSDRDFVHLYLCSCRRRLQPARAPIGAGLQVAAKCTKSDCHPAAPVKVGAWKFGRFARPRRVWIVAGGCARCARLPPATFRARLRRAPTGAGRLRVTIPQKPDCRPAAPAEAGAYNVMSGLL